MNADVCKADVKSEISLIKMYDNRFKLTKFNCGFITSLCHNLQKYFSNQLGAYSIYNQKGTCQIRSKIPLKNVQKTAKGNK